LNRLQATQLQETVHKKEVEMQAMEERYKKYIEKAKSVIKTLDPKQVPDPMVKLFFCPKYSLSIFGFFAQNIRDFDKKNTAIHAPKIITMHLSRNELF
jgi:hypothetical protein